MADEKQSLEAKVTKWLGTEGYRLEYQTLKAFRDVGIRAALGAYIPTQEGKPREIDVNAMLQKARGDRKYEARWICECKYSTGKPWVLLDSDGEMKMEDIWDAMPKTERLARKVVVRENSKLTETLHFRGSQQIAHTVVQAWVKAEKADGETGTNKQGKELENQKQGNRDFAYESLQKIAHAGWDCAEFIQKREASVMCMVIPCLVVDGPLFLAEFNYDKDEFVVSGVPSGRICWGGCRESTLVDVVNINGIHDYAAKVKQTFELLTDSMMANT